MKTVAGIRDSLPAEQQQSVGVMVGNYGEQGAIEILGPKYHLPDADQFDELGVAARVSDAAADDADCGWIFAEAGGRGVYCMPVGGTQGNSEGVKNEESEYHSDIFVCGPPKMPWPEFWSTHQRFG